MARLMKACVFLAALAALTYIVLLSVHLLGLDYDTHLSSEQLAAIVAISQHEDIDQRSEWQMGQIQRFCHKYSLDSQLYALPNWQKLNRHLLFDDKKKLVFCFVPKAGCTTLRRLLFASQGVIPPESVNWTHVSEHEYLRPAIQKASFLNKSLTYPQRLKRIKKYFKFIMVRNPLERLVSAYCDKIEHPIIFNKTLLKGSKSEAQIRSALFPKNLDLFEGHRRWILSKYHPAELKRWVHCGGDCVLQPSFTDYVSWLVDSDEFRLNEHFAPIIIDALPCAVQYNFYANFKNYSREVKLLMKRFNISSNYFVDHSSHAPGQETSTKLHHYYSQLSPQLRRDLFEYLFQELDFYYHLYPEEQWSHVELLGVTEPVLTRKFWS